MWYPSAGWTTLFSVVQPALGYHITNSQSRYITPTRLKSAHYSLHNNAPSSRKILKMDVLTSETCWAVNWHNKASVIKLVYFYSNIKMMHGPIRIRLEKEYLRAPNVCQTGLKNTGNSQMFIEDTLIWSLLLYCTNVTSVIFSNKVANIKLSKEKYNYEVVCLLSSYHVFDLSLPCLPDGVQRISYCVHCFILFSVYVHTITIHTLFPTRNSSLKLLCFISRPILSSQSK